jgi:hypothetical protein
MDVFIESDLEPIAGVGLEQFAAAVCGRRAQ